MAVAEVWYRWDVFFCDCEGESLGESRELSLLTWVLISGSREGGEVGEQGDAGQSSIVINGSSIKHTDTATQLYYHNHVKERGQKV